MRSNPERETQPDQPNGGRASAKPEFAAAVDAEVRRRLAALLDGIVGYQRHPYRRELADPPILWRDGRTRLLDYGGAADGRPVLVVPSLINRSHVLDITAERSLLRWLATQSLRPLLIDWGAPDAVERGFDLTDYIAGRLAPVLDRVAALADGPVPVVGYCMGGLLAVALARLRPRAVGGLALLATPWDFHAGGEAQAQAVAAMALTHAGPLAALGELPVDAIQAMFTLVDTLSVARKFMAFGALDPQSERARLFVALEDWLNDGVALAAPVAHECLADWYGNNTPARSAWRVADLTVEPGALKLPALVIVPQGDRIVPPASAQALAAALPQARGMTVPLGHIGMVVGGGAPKQVWKPLASWLTAA